MDRAPASSAECRESRRDLCDERHRTTPNDMTHPEFSTCDLCDAHENDPVPILQPLAPVFLDLGGVTRFSGPVATVRCFEDNTRIREAVDSPGEGRVLVVDGGASVRRALVGGNLAAAAARNGWVGIVVDGAVRDLHELRAAAVGIRALALMPQRSMKRGEGQRDVPIVVQGLPVRPGQWLYADEDGIVVSVRPLP
jgi:regulator of ribonuclease activity A